MRRFALSLLLAIFVCLQLPASGFAQSPTNDDESVPVFIPGSGNGEAEFNAPVPGWRVQVFASMFEKESRDFARTVEAKTGLRAHLVYSDYNHKVQVGSFSTRINAEVLRERLISLGYTSPWVVASRIQPEDDDKNAEADLDISGNHVELIVPPDTLVAVSMNEVDFARVSDLQKSALENLGNLEDQTPEPIVAELPAEESQPEKTSPVVKLPKESKPKAQSPPPAQISMEQKSGSWRIQIMTLFSLKYTEVEETAELARQKTGITARVFTLPRYKEGELPDPSERRRHVIALGEFDTREEAEISLEMVRKSGYPDAFTIQLEK